MKKVLALMVMLFLVLFASSALAAGKLVTTQETLRVLPSYGGFYAYFYAEVTNSGNKTVTYNDGLLELFNADGDSLESTTWFYCYPAYLEPGETGYLWGTVSIENIENASDVDDYSFTITGKGANVNPVHYFPATIRYQVEKGSWWTYEYLYSTLTNDLDKTVYDFRVVIALKDKSGKLLWCSSSTASNVGIPTNTTIEIRDSLSYDSIISQLETEGIDVGTLDFSVIAYYEAE